MRRRRRHRLLRWVRGGLRPIRGTSGTHPASIPLTGGEALEIDSQGVTLGAATIDKPVPPGARVSTAPAGGQLGSPAQPQSGALQSSGEILVLKVAARMRIPGSR